MFPLLKTTGSQGLPRSQGNFASTDRILGNLHLGLCQLFDSDQTHVVSGAAVVDRQGLHIVPTRAYVVVTLGGPAAFTLLLSEG